MQCTKLTPTPLPCARTTTIFTDLYFSRVTDLAVVSFKKTAYISFLNAEIISGQGPPQQSFSSIWKISLSHFSQSVLKVNIYF